MKNILIGIVSTLLLLGLAYGGFLAHANHQATKAAAGYLFAPTPVKDKDGRSLSRADLLDAILHEMVQKPQEPKQQ